MNEESNNNICAICQEKTGRLFTCNECRVVFCMKHVQDHEENIENKLKTFEQEINQWEEESIERIRKRTVQLREELKSVVDQLKENIHQSERLKNYSEIDIQNWKKQFQTIQKAFSVQIKPDYDNEQSNDRNERQVKRFRSESTNIRPPHDRFNQVVPWAVLPNNNTVATSSNSIRSIICGTNWYSTGTNVVEFQVEQVFQKGIIH